MKIPRAIPTTRFSVLVLLLLCTNFIPSSHGCNENVYYIIRNTVSGFVVEAASTAVINIQHFTGYSRQLWKFEGGTRAGYFYIVNKQYGYVLTGSSNNRLSLSTKDGSTSKQWYVNSGGQLVNVAYRKAVDVPGAKYYAGNTLQLYSDNGTGAQKFYLQLVTRMMLGLTKKAEPEVISQNSELGPAKIDNAL